MSKGEDKPSLIGRKVNQDDMDIQGFGENVAELLTSGNVSFFIFGSTYFWKLKILIGKLPVPTSPMKDMDLDNWNETTTLTKTKYILR